MSPALPVSRQQRFHLSSVDVSETRRRPGSVRRQLNACLQRSKASATDSNTLPGYWGMIRRLDEAYGRLLDALKSLGLLDNTIVLFTFDHGCHFKTRNSEYKRSCHEASIRVPTVFTGPGLFAGGQLRELVSLIDLPLTLLDAAGIDVPSTMQGRSLMPVLRRQATEAWPDEVYIQISESEIGRAIRTRRWKYAVTAPGIDGHSAPWSETYSESFLYDLEADPYELNNLIGTVSHRPLCDRLQERLIARIVATGEPRLSITTVSLREGGQTRLTPEELLM